jgi:hypothetical protein
VRVFGLFLLLPQLALVGLSWWLTLSKLP